MSASNTRRRVLMMALTVAVLAGCASTRLEGTWSDPALPAESDPRAGAGGRRGAR
jgi:hypothetical protein